MGTFNRVVFGAFAALSFASAAVAGTCTPEWDLISGSPGFAGSNTTVNSLHAHDDGTGMAMYAAGSFAQAGSQNTTVNRIAKWTGTDWTALGLGLNQLASDMVSFNDGSGNALFVGGAFTQAGGMPANRIAKWNGAAWSALGAGFNGNVNALAVYNDGTGAALYAAGDFSSSGTTPVGRIAKWNPGTGTWSAVGAGFANFSVRSLHVHNDGSGQALFAGGAFTMSGATAINRIAKWNGATWSSLGTGIGDGSVIAMETFGNQLYVGGSFVQVNGGTILRLARWNGTTWASVGANGIPSDVLALEAFDDGAGNALFVGGNFTAVDMMQAFRVARWSGTAWSELDGGTGARVDALGALSTPSRSSLFVGGVFLTAGTGMFNSAGHVAEWLGCPVTGSNCPADLNGDGQINSSDLGLLLTAWGPCPGCNADINGDGQVNSSDLGLLLTAWGPCP